MILDAFIITTLLTLLAWQIRNIYLQKQTIKKVIKKEGTEEMDKKIKKIQKKTKSLEKDEASLLKMDKKHDAKMEKCDMKMKKK